MTRQQATHLPHSTSSFIGRGRELAEAQRLLGLTQLLTLTGPGGCGKTRLAMELARQAVDGFRDGVWWAGLGALHDPVLVPQTVAGALGIREQADRPFVDLLAEYLRSRQLLLVLDNCEHLVADCATLAERLLGLCPELRLLATSRAALSIGGERIWLVPSLSLPDPRTFQRASLGGAGSTDAERLCAVAESEAVQLFVERAASVCPTFSLTPENAPAVADICRRLDGIPLAIELAAARLKVLTATQIAGRLEDSFHLLTGGSRTAVPRQQTLRATIDWSYALLSEAERVLFARLSAFTGGWTLPAAEQVCSGRDPEGHEIASSDVLDLLAQLVDKSLVVMQEWHGEARYHLLEIVRQYALEKLRASGHARITQGRHAAFFLLLVEEAEPRLNTVARGPWLLRLDVEHDNLRAAMRFAVDTGQFELAMRLAGALLSFWFQRDYWREGVGWLDEIISGVQDAPEGSSALVRARAKALTSLGFLRMVLVDLEAAHSALTESTRLWRRSQESASLGLALAWLSRVVLFQGNPAGARAIAEESLAILRTLGPEHRWQLGLALENRAVVAAAQDDYEQAVALFEESAALFREIGDQWGLTAPLSNLGLMLAQRGDFARARELYREILAISYELGQGWFTARNLEELAVVTRMQGDYAGAAVLLGAADGVRERTGSIVVGGYQAEYDRDVAAVRAGLDEEAFAAGWSAGRALSLEQCIAYVRDAKRDPQPPLAEPRHAGAHAASEAGGQPDLRIFAFGHARVERAGRLLTAADWTYARPRELVFFLLCQPPQTTEQIGLALWPDASPEQTRRNLHVTVHRARRVLGRPDWIVHEHRRYRFNRALPYWFDVEIFESNLEEARRLRDTAPDQAIQRLEQATSLYGGVFLEDSVQGDWFEGRRAELERQYLQALLALGELRYATRHYEAAADAYRQAIAHDNLLEEAHRELMRCYARQAEHGKALRQYQTLVELLADELGVSPAAETRALADQLRGPSR